MQSAMDAVSMMRRAALLVAVAAHRARDARAQADDPIARPFGHSSPVAWSFAAPSGSASRLTTRAGTATPPWWEARASD